MSDEYPDLTNDLLDDPAYLREWCDGPPPEDDAMECPECRALGDTRDYETGEFLADSCDVCAGSGWMEPSAAYQIGRQDIEDRGAE